MTAVAKLVLLPQALQDLAEAHRWYEGRRVGLGREFLESVQACFDFVCAHPRALATVHENYRRAKVRRFPYVVLYEYNGGVATIYAVFHTARDPQKWRERLP